MPYACVLQPEKEEGEVGVWLLLLLASCRGSRIYKERHVIQTRDEEEHYYAADEYSVRMQCSAHRQRMVSNPNGICLFGDGSLSAAAWTGLVSTIVRMR